jgi:hypothetical protein
MMAKLEIHPNFRRSGGSHGKFAGLVKGDKIGISKRRLFEGKYRGILDSTIPGK